VNRIISKLKQLNKTQKVASAFALVIILVVVAGTTFLILRSDTPAAEATITYSTNNPDESKDNADNYDWRGAFDEPKKIRISKIQVDAYVQKAGIDQNNEIAVPNNVHLAGWFANSQKPGQKGLSIIAGHVSGETTDGVFKELDQLAEGDTFEVELGSGDIKKYSVIKVMQVEESKSEQVLFNQDPGVISQLNLVTCGGEFDDANDQYRDRVIVYAKLLDY
jgi:LPXTG-site transpeptidase (sortase) family protein